MNEEQVWILQAQRGDDDAFTKLVETYQRPVYNLCYRMLGEPEYAEDAAQETFLRAYRNIGRYDINRPFATWLLSIAAHYCIDRLRRRRLPTFSMDAETDEGYEIEIPDVSAPNPEAEAARSEQREQIHQLVQSLDSTDRAAIVLRYWYDFSEVEIAESLSLTVPAVKSRLHRARRALAKKWEDSSAQTGMERMPYETPAF
ncbi:MAG: sigma-70 family RNA polymerase sigma factor [Chloroflexota bacterium]